VANLFDSFVLNLLYFFQYNNKYYSAYFFEIFKEKYIFCQKSFCSQISIFQQYYKISFIKIVNQDIILFIKYIYYQKKVKIQYP